MNGNVIIKYFDVQGHSIEPDIKVYKSLKLAVVNANKRKRTLGAYNQIRIHWEGRPFESRPIICLFNYPEAQPSQTAGHQVGTVGTVSIMQTVCKANTFEFAQRRV